MPSWSDLLSEIRAADGRHDSVRRKYLARLHKHTKRNVIAYYSGWLQKGGLHRQLATEFGLNDTDKNGFMTAIHKLDRSLGLDLLLHTPGGSMAATESLVDYLRAMFGTNIRAVVPQLAMSGGTMIALACKSIIMGEHSSLGPIDPQIYGLPAHGVIEEFERAAKEIKAHPERVPLWQPIIAKYNPTLLGECYNATKWADQMVREWLHTGMFAKDQEAERDRKIEKVVNELGRLALTLSHERHISLRNARDDLELSVIGLEEDAKLQDLVLSIHHACIQTLTETSAIKIIENHTGVAFIQSISVHNPQA